MTDFQVNKRRDQLRTYLRNLSITNESTAYIATNAEAFGKALYPGGGAEAKPLAQCRGDLTVLERLGDVRRIQYLKGIIYWTVIE